MPYPATAMMGVLTFVNATRGFREHFTYSRANVEIPEWLMQVQGRGGSVRRSESTMAEMLKPAFTCEAATHRGVGLTLLAHQQFSARSAVPRERGRSRAVSSSEFLDNPAREV
jgi:hypothetical protein